ncbi:hypothetical protein ABL78_0976 [Leptomonas seymouri]|uniref:Pleckstrin homology domain-containing protein n=1 Tax=Leptomonas seymouri TaxID=5684 RepID=A0A0N1PF06_LEPSE|nr:hypothetical protein ABL78_0976 [Leptomonas seymouri]|eukprot:KPI89904.1 hypothetical protein ABL78_0976 [Leptomonas seymouri]
MDSIHEAHLSRILEGRRRRGVLGEYTAPVAAPHSDPPPPPSRHVYSAASQTAEERKASAASQTKSDWGAAAAERPSAQAARASSQGLSDWRQSVPQNGADASAAPLFVSPRARATQSGAVQFQSPGRVPSLAYSTPASSSSQRRSSSRQRPISAPSPAWAPQVVEGISDSVKPLPPPLYIPRPRSAPRAPLHQPSVFFTPHASHWPAPTLQSRDGYGGYSWQRPSSSPVRPIFDDNAVPITSAWRNTSDAGFRNCSTGFHISPLPIHREEGSATPLMAWPSEQGGVDKDRRRSSRHRSHHRHNHSNQRRYNDDGMEADAEVELPPRRRNSRSGGRSRAVSRRRAPPSALMREGSARRGGSYAAPVVYMGDSYGMGAMSPGSTEGTSRRRRSRSPASPQRSRNLPIPRPFKEQRKSALGLPDARSTMDLRTSIETLRAGDWFYKWSTKGDAVHRRWVWVDTKSYLLVWSSRETRNAHFCGDIRLDQISQITSRDLMSVDEDGFPKTYYVLLIETTKRVLQMATELKDKCDVWFEALNNVMVFIHRNDIAKGALVPD